MTEPQRPSLQRRLILRLGAVCAVAAAVLVLAARGYGEQAADKAFDQILAASALAIAEQVYVSDGRLQVDLPYASLDMLAFARDDRVFYGVWAPDGSALTGYEDLPIPAAPPEAEPRFFDAHYRGETVRFVTLGRLLAEPEANGWARVQVGQTRAERRALATDLALNALLPIMIFMALVVVLVWLSVRRGLSPLARVERELGQRQPNELTPLAVNAPREIDATVQAINAFMGRLDRNLTQMQHLIADAAHQLRTPLASLRAQASLALDEDDPERLRRIVRRIDRNAALAGRLTGQLLTHAVVTHRANLDRREPLDLCATARQAVREAASIAQGADRRIRLRLPETSMSLHGDVVVIREALRNLVENALQHGPEDGRVTVCIERRGEGILCAVCDEGRGIDPDDAPRLMQRFERGHDAGAPGSGLGLAIVAAMAEQHGAEVAFLRRDDGACVQLLFPEAR